MFGVPFKQNPRNGQSKVYKKYFEDAPRNLNIKLPTGYGKTITAVGSYAILKNQGKANRLLFIFPTDAQLIQFEQDGHQDMEAVGITENNAVVDVRFYGINALRKSNRDTHQVFAITVQALSQSTGSSVVRDLMEKHRWLVVVDEYHHYGVDKTWGKSVTSLPYEHLLAMSATPRRPNEDSAFGTPDIEVHYRDAVGENAVKPLIGHSYNYRIDTVNKEGDVVSFTTSDLIKEAGGSSPAQVDKLLISRKMRWSPKYVSPLVTTPIERMIVQRLYTPYKLQAIVGAMCVSHAELVCSQVKSIFPELSIDWVGTGDNGRSQEENAKILAKFCPKKDGRGNRSPTLDVLVHVGMAGEGLDSIFVSEVIHLNSASINNSNNQENGRASRYLEGVTGNINFDSSSEYATSGYIGEAIMDAIDLNPPSQSPDNNENPEPDEPMPIPDEPMIQIWDISLESINSGDLKKMAEVAKIADVRGIDYASLTDDMTGPEWAKIETIYRGMRTREAEQHNEQATIAQWREAINGATSSLTSQIINLMFTDGVRPERSVAGDVKKRINKKKKGYCGEITNDIDVCKKHYFWLADLQAELTGKRIPSWLL